MELYQLKSFIAVAEEQHLTRAATRLHISQPSLSTHIKALEEELGLNLFIRTPKGMILTNEGKPIKLKAELALEAVEAVRKEADRRKKNITGVVRIGLNIDAQYLKALDLLGALQHGFPGIELHFSRCHSLEAYDQVQNGQLDAAFVFETPKNSGLKMKWLTTFGIVIVAPYRWKSRLQKPDLEKIVQFPWIWTDERCPFNRISKQLFKPLDRLPEKSVVVDHDTTIRKLVASNAGLGLMIETEAYEAARQKQVTILGDRISNLNLYLLFSRKRSIEPVLNAIISMICNLWSQPTTNETIAVEAKGLLPPTLGEPVSDKIGPKTRFQSDAQQTTRR